MGGELSVKVKICGITNSEDALAAMDAGADALGFVFYKKSPRYIIPERARQVISKLPQNILKVGVFVDAPQKSIKRIAKFCGLQAIQLHGEESPQFCKCFPEYKVIKAFRIKNRIDLNKILCYKVFAYLFDAFVVNRPGGTGNVFNWKLLNNKPIKRTIFLSGGLDLDNVKKAIEVVQPQWVDVSSSVEISPGKKDHVKLKQFIELVKK